LQKQADKIPFTHFQMATKQFLMAIAARSRYPFSASEGDALGDGCNCVGALPTPPGTGLAVGGVVVAVAGGWFAGGVGVTEFAINPREVTIAYSI
jgi:uncharacterized protein GlcG (DUF336 family)